VILTFHARARLVDLGKSRRLSAMRAQQEVIDADAFMSVHGAR